MEKKMNRSDKFEANWVLFIGRLLRMILLTVLVQNMQIQPASYAGEADPDRNNDGIVDIKDISLITECLQKGPDSSSKCHVADVDSAGFSPDSESAGAADGR